MLPRDGVSKLQVAVTDLAGVYLDALKDVQNEVERMHQANELGSGTSSLKELTSLLAERVISLHEVIDQQAARLKRLPIRGAAASRTARLGIATRCRHHGVTVAGGGSGGVARGCTRPA